MSNIERNWAGNYRYAASELLEPDSPEQVREAVARSERVKVLGTRHSFNGIADTSGTLISLRGLNRVIGLDRVNRRVTVEGGIRYGELGRYLHERGYALHNLASLPHISVAGAIATATHGSGDRNGNLSTAVHALDIVKADGETISFSRDGSDGEIAGAIVGLGALGVVTRVTLNVIPTFEMSQTVYEGLSLSRLEKHFDDVFALGYSVSLFTNWRSSSFNQVWVKRRSEDGESGWEERSLHGAVRAASKLHPVPGLAADPCSEQLGIPGPWYDRMPHFRLAFTPSAGDELQSEYFVPRSRAYEALCAIDGLKEALSPLLYTSEIRTIAADDLWMSPCYDRHSVGIHFTWKPDPAAVERALPLIEEKLEPFGARPHWGKAFAMPPEKLRPMYEKLPEFRALLSKCDPRGKFRNDFLDRYIP
mgnify:CR=1 FL=1